MYVCMYPAPVQPRFKSIPELQLFEEFPLLLKVSGDSHSGSRPPAARSIAGDRFGGPRPSAFP